MELCLRTVQPGLEELFSSLGCGRFWLRGCGGYGFEVKLGARVVPQVQKIALRHFMAES